MTDVRKVVVPATGKSVSGVERLAPQALVRHQASLDRIEALAPQARVPSSGPQASAPQGVPAQAPTPAPAEAPQQPAPASPGSGNGA